MQFIYAYKKVTLASVWRMDCIQKKIERPVREYYSGPDEKWYVLDKHANDKDRSKQILDTF